MRTVVPASGSRPRSRSILRRGWSVRLRMLQCTDAGAARHRRLPRGARGSDRGPHAAPLRDPFTVRTVRIKGIFFSHRQVTDALSAGNAEALGGGHDPGAGRGPLAARRSAGFPTHSVPPGHGVSRTPSAGVDSSTKDDQAVIRATRAAAPVPPLAAADPPHSPPSCGPGSARSAPALRCSRSL